MEKVSPMWMEEKPISIEVEKGRKSSLNDPIIMEELDRALRNSKAGSVPGRLFKKNRRGAGTGTRVDETLV